jgi:hypothetical protein
MKIQKLFALGFLVILFSSAPLYGQTTEAEEAYCGDCMETPIWDGWSWEHMAQYYGSGGGFTAGHGFHGWTVYGNCAQGGHSTWCNRSQASVEFLEAVDARGLSGALVSKTLGNIQYSRNAVQVIGCAGRILAHFPVSTHVKRI